MAHVDVLPNHQRGHAKLKLSWNAYVHSTGICCTHVFFALLAPICMLSRCLLAKFCASELGRKFIRSVLLVGYVV